MTRGRVGRGWAGTVRRGALDSAAGDGIDERAWPGQGRGSADVAGSRYGPADAIACAPLGTMRGT